MEEELLRGLAAYLAADGVGYYHDTDPYPAGVQGIFLTEAPSSHPEAFSLASYSVQDAVSGADSTVGVQVRVRAATVDTTNSMASAVFQSLQGLWGVSLGTVRTRQIFRQSSAPLGPNGEGLYERTDNYYVDAYFPAPHRY
ncbi:hypothetical protein [Tessaracoccus sp.]